MLVMLQKTILIISKLVIMEIEKVGFLESNVGRKSNSRLTVAICSGICVFATMVEGCGKIMAIYKGDCTVQADWTAIAILVGAVLLGAGANKAAQRININPPKTEE